MGKVIVNIKPFRTPNFVIPSDEKIWGQDTKDVSFPLSALEADILSDMCDQFRAEIFNKAGKKDPSPPTED